MPTLDLANAEATGEGLAALDEACRNHGFFLLQNHGLDRAIEAMWQASEDFFKQPQASKRALKRTESSPLGYFDQEMTKRQRDLKEVFDFMRPSASGRNLNQWPDDEAFKQTLSDFFEAASRLLIEPWRWFTKRWRPTERRIAHGRSRNQHGPT